MDNQHDVRSLPRGIPDGKHVHNIMIYTCYIPIVIYFEIAVEESHPLIA